MRCNTFIWRGSDPRVQRAFRAGGSEKFIYDEAGKVVLSPAGKDSVSIVDLANPENPKIVANLALKNSVLGPPMNLDIDPTGSVALVADSVDVTKDGDALKMVPVNKVYVIDLKANPPKLAATVTVGKQPSGLSFNAAGNLALVTNDHERSRLREKRAEGEDRYRAK